MKSICVSLRCSAAAILLAAIATAAPKPKLVVAIAIDQFRYDYLTRFRSEYHGGFDRLLTKGAVFTNARYEHFPTVTAIGHSTFLSGATPAISGIVGNEWWERAENRSVTSVSDDKTQLLGGNAGQGSSPHRMLVSTVGDELKMADQGRSKVIGVSLKDRAAILPAGHMADGAFWLDARSGNFVSSTYYFASLPGWAKDFNASRSADRFKGAHFGQKTMPAEPGEKLYAALEATPFGNELIEAFAEHALQGEQLGRRGITDLLAVSFSSNDYVGHAFGPDSPEAHEICVATDKLLGKFFAYIDSSVGLQNVVIVMTADHGVAPVPEVNEARKMPGGRLPGSTISEAVQSALSKKYGVGKWIVSPAENALYLNLDLISEKNLDRAEVDKVAAEACRAVPHVFRVYTREQLMNGAVLEDQVGRRMQNGYYAGRGGDVEVLLEPYWLASPRGTSHGTPFSYDAHVPVIFMGPGVRPGRYHGNIAVNDIAPTLATMLDVETPAGSVGRVLSEMMTE